ncbi:MAG: pmbA [Gammaproteobacteria bacterium]|nr:pmbA [Gammaproteobacteria bacterium]
MSSTDTLAALDDKSQIEARLSALADHVLQKAAELGATSAEVDASVDNGFSLTVRLGEVETVEHQRDNGFAVSVYFGKRKGTASTTDLSPAAIEAAVTAACQFAQYAEVDPFTGLADQSHMAKTVPELDLYHPWNLSVADAVDIAVQCENAARETDKRITNSDGTSLSTSNGVHLYTNTHGFKGMYASSYHSLNCMPLAAEKEDMQRDYSYTVSRDPKLLTDPLIVGREAAARAVKRLHARTLTTRKVPVILHAELATGFLRHLLSAIGGTSQYRKASFLSDKLHQVVCAKHVSLHETPHVPKAIGSRPFDSDGVATYAKDFIRNGELVSYILGTYSARKLGLQSTANAGGVNNLAISHSDLNLQQLCQKMGSGLLVTELIGHGVNIVTGDYSEGAVGFWVEQGEIQYPVAEVTIAGNLRDLWLNLVAVGSDVDKRGRIHSGSILLEQMTVAGQ